MSYIYVAASVICSVAYMTGTDPTGWWLFGAFMLLWRAIRTA